MGYLLLSLSTSDVKSISVNTIEASSTIHLLRNFEESRLVWARNIMDSLMIQRTRPLTL